MQKCSICATELHGNYCHQCGQKVTGRRVSFKAIFGDFFQEVFTLERSFFATLLHLVRYPKRVIENYWAGNRRYYLSPGKMLVYTVFVIGLQVAFFDKSQVLGIEVEMGDLEKHTKNLVSPQLLVIMLLFPLFSITSFLTYRKQRHSFAEHVIATSYLLALCAILLTVLGTALHHIFGLYQSYFFPVFLVMMFVGSVRTYSNSRKFIRVVGSFLLEILIFIVSFMLLLTVLWLSDSNMVEFDV